MTAGHVERIIKHLAQNDSDGALHIVNEDNFDPNNPDKDGLTPIFYAAMFGDIALACRLIEKRANANYLDSDGSTALVSAVCSKAPRKMEMISLLRQYGANINHQNQFGQTALMIAANLQTSNNLDPTELLLRMAANPNLIDKDGKTALFYAITRLNPERVLLLLKYGSDPNICDEKGQTALFTAVRYHLCPETVELLLQYGANPNHADNSGKTPLSIASSLPKCHIVKGKYAGMTMEHFLISLGATQRESPRAAPGSNVAQASALPAYIPAYIRQACVIS